MSVDYRSEGLPRRALLRWVAASPLLGMGVGCGSTGGSGVRRPDQLFNLLQFEGEARVRLGQQAYEFLAGGADDEHTMAANREAFRNWQIRVRRLIDVSRTDQSIELFGQTLGSPILLAPMGDQGNWHPDGELASARAAAVRGHRAIVSSLSTFSIEEIAAASPEPLWFQLYPTADRAITAELIQRAEASGCRVLVLTVDTPVTGNRERQKAVLGRILGAVKSTGNFAGRDPFPFPLDPTMTWDMVGWLREHCRLPLVLKGIVTREDAQLAVERGVDGVIVSNHGGRQEESGRGSLDSLREVLEGVGDRMPVLVDGGFRRGTDVFKALALGARAVCIGRPYGYGLAAFGQSGVERVLELLQAELVRIQQLAGTPRLGDIRREFLVRG